MHTFASTTSQMSLSSFGNFSASGAATLRTPDCSSALGLYVPSVCLFFFTTQNSQHRTAKTMTKTPKMTVGATIAAMLVACKWKNAGQWSVFGDTWYCLEVSAYYSSSFFYLHHSRCHLKIFYLYKWGNSLWKKAEVSTPTMPIRQRNVQMSDRKPYIIHL